MNEARNRIDNDFSPTFPDKDIICENCVFRKLGVLGYRNAYCGKYPDGKPNGILFNHDPCKYYEKENG